MKKLLLLFLLCTSICLAQQGINYKAIISDDDAPVKNQQIALYFTIIEAATTDVYTESHAPTTDDNGLIFVNIGEGTATSGDFKSIDWSKEQYLKVSVNIGKGITDLGTTAFKNVPYALYAEKAAVIATGGINDANKVLTTDTSGNPEWALKTEFSGVSQLEKITEGGNTGYRLLGSDPNNYGNIGDHALDLSYNDIGGNDTHGATGDFSTALGINTHASGVNSTAIGYATHAANDYSMALGYETEAIGFNSTAFGSNTKASGNNTMAMGTNTEALGDFSTTTGYGSKTTGEFATALGFYTEATGLSSIAMGEGCIASGNISSVMGLGTTAEAYAQTTVGLYNTELAITNGTGSYVAETRLFVVGNGTGNSNRSDAMVVLKNGNTTINGDLDVEEVHAADSGDADMKAYIYGLIIGSNGSKANASSAGYQTSKISTGHYRITFNNAPSSHIDYLVMATLHQDIGFVRTSKSQQYIDIRTYNTSETLTDMSFNFVVYKK